jgi:hypothetical protein
MPQRYLKMLSEVHSKFFKSRYRKHLGLAIWVFIEGTIIYALAHVERKISPSSNCPCFSAGPGLEGRKQGQL